MLKKIKGNLFKNFAFFHSFAGNGMFLVFFLSILTGVLDVIGISMLIPILQLSEGSGELSSEIGQGSLFFLNLFDNLNLEPNIYTALGFLIIVFFIKGGFVYQSFYLRAKVRQSFIKGIRFKLIDGLSNYKYDRFIKMNAGQMNSSFTSEVGFSSSAFDKYLMSIYQLMIVFAYLVMTIWLDYKITLVIVLTVSPILLLFRYLNSSSKKLSNKVKDEERELNHTLLESIIFFKYLKSTATFLKQKNLLRNKAESIENLQFDIGLLRGKLNAMKEIFVISLVSVLVLIQLLLFKESISGILIVLVLMYRNFGAFMQFQNSWQGYMSVLGSLEGVKGTLRQMEDGKETIKTEILDSAIDTISCNNISFSYGGQKIIKNVSLTIQRNKTIALVGESGSGKSTIINLIIGLLKPTEGEVKINDQKLKDIDLTSFRKNIGYITQEPVIFSESVYENVTFTNERSPDLLRRFWEACEQAQIALHIRNLPEKEDTVLGDFGVTLSGGQRQRVSIARELFRQPTLLIMDEATSSLDSETEDIIRENIDALQGQITIVTVAHRLATIKSADTICVVHKGKVEATGSFNKLIDSSERFNTMLLKQGLT